MKKWLGVCFGALLCVSGVSGRACAAGDIFDGKMQWVNSLEASVSVKHDTLTHKLIGLDIGSESVKNSTMDSETRILQVGQSHGSFLRTVSASTDASAARVNASGVVDAAASGVVLSDETEFRYRFPLHLDAIKLKYMYFGYADRDVKGKVVYDDYSVNTNIDGNRYGIGFQFQPVKDTAVQLGYTRSMMELQSIIMYPEHKAQRLSVSAFPLKTHKTGWSATVERITGEAVKTNFHLNTTVSRKLYKGLSLNAELGLYTNGTPSDEGVFSEMGTRLVWQYKDAYERKKVRRFFEESYSYAGISLDYTVTF